MLSGSRARQVCCGLRFRSSRSATCWDTSLRARPGSISGSLSMIFGRSVSKFQEGRTMVPWPGDDESLLIRYVEQLGYSAAYRSWLRPFQRFVREHSPHGGLTERVFRTWIRKRAEQSPRSFVIRQTEFIKGFLDWLVKQSVLGSHPLEQLQRKYECRSMRAITGALMSSKPNPALEALRPLPRYGSHLGDTMRQHVQCMRTLRYRYRHENAFLHFDRFLQQRPGEGGVPRNTHPRVCRHRALTMHEGTPADSGSALSRSVEPARGFDRRACRSPLAASGSEQSPPSLYIHDRGS